jgi:hypothetical protein
MKLVTDDILDELHDIYLAYHDYPDGNSIINDQIETDWWFNSFTKNDSGL